eukprot:634281-Hanusia_phi.AAC.1
MVERRSCSSIRLVFLQDMDRAGEGAMEGCELKSNFRRRVERRRDGCRNKPRWMRTEGDGRREEPQWGNGDQLRGVGVRSAGPGPPSSRSIKHAVPHPRPESPPNLPVPPPRSVASNAQRFERVRALLNATLES